MFVPFESLPDQSRVWVYQSVRPLTPGEQETISSYLQEFTQHWQAHQQPLQASFTILNDHYVVLAVNESYNQASGCSIDTSVRAMQQIVQQLHIDFFNRNYVGFMMEDRVVMLKLSELADKQAAGLWNEDTMVFNALAGTKGEINNRWLLKASETWLTRYLKKQTA
ncbi:MAG: hypothetical protein MUE95_03220 [Cyclobacteriaceae bacterium]|jgi:hypothetical protein|nr:hypothetical protein [Cyclobacteriaceae bacterium]